MADNLQSRAEQLQAFVQRWQQIAAHPVQALSDWFTPRFRPEAHQQFLDITSEIALNPAALAERLGMDTGRTASGTPALKSEPRLEAPGAGEDRTSTRDQSATLDTLEALQHRVQQLTSPAQSRSQAHYRDQGMGL